MKKLHAMLNELALMGQKEALLDGYGVTSAAHLTDDDLQHLIGRLQQMKDARQAPLRRMRSDVLTTLTLMGIYRTNADWPRVNAYIQQPRIGGKLLYDMNADELRALNTKLRIIMQKQAQRGDDTKHISSLN